MLVTKHLESSHKNTSNNIYYSLNAKLWNDNALVQSLDWAHCGLDVERPDVLPMLLQQGDQEVHGKMNILDQIILGHAHVSYCNRQTQNLLHLELDGRLQVIHLLLQVVAVSHQRGELASLRQKYL